MIRKERDRKKRVASQGFRAFELRELKERKIKNPRTGEVDRNSCEKIELFPFLHLSKASAG